MTQTLIIDYSKTGTGEAVAKQLASNLHADYYQIKPKRKYAASMWAAWDQAQAETAAHQMPALITDFPDLTNYNQFILGGPVWGKAIANPLRAFLEQVDFQGKPVAAFWTYYDHDEHYAESLKSALQNGNYQFGLPLTMTTLNQPAKLAVVLNNWLAKFEH